MISSHYWRRRIESKSVFTARKKSAFKNRVREWASKLEIEVTWLGVRPMHNKWASCSTNGHLNFSADLLTLDENTWDYVIVHELLHFRAPNHGKLWRSLMRAHLGNYEESEIKLKQSQQAALG